MADAGAGRHHAEIVEGVLPPAQEVITFPVSLVFELDVVRERLRGAEIVDLHRVVDDEIDRRQRIDFLRIAAELSPRVAHGGEIHHGGHAGEVLHQHARRAIGDFVLGLALVIEPAGDGFDVVGDDGVPVLEAQQVFEQDFQRVGQAGDAGEPGLLGVRQRIVGIGLAARC